MKDIEKIVPIELIKPLPIEMEQLSLQAEPPASCDKGTIQATCKPSGIIS